MFTLASLTRQVEAGVEATRIGTAAAVAVVLGVSDSMLFGIWFSSKVLAMAGMDGVDGMVLTGTRGAKGLRGIPTS